MEEMETMMVENTEVAEEEMEETRGNGALIAAGVTILGIGAAAGAAFLANKKGKLDGFKENRKAKKIQKLEKKLGKLYTPVETVEVEETETVEE